MGIQHIDKVNRIKALATKATKNSNSWFVEKFIEEWQVFTQTYGDADLIEAASKDGTFRETLHQIRTSEQGQNF